MPRRCLRMFLVAPLRRPGRVAVPTLAAVLVAGVGALLAREQYRAGATVRATWEGVEWGAAAPAAADVGTRRLLAVRQRALALDALEKVIQEAVPYPSVGGRAISVSQQVEMMMRSVSVEARGADGYEIRYVHPDPAKAALVPTRLAGLLVEGSRRDKAEQPDPATLQARLAAAREAMEEKRAAVQRLRDGLPGSGPDVVTVPPAWYERVDPERRAAAPDLVNARAEAVVALGRDFEQAMAAYLAIDEEWRAAERAFRLGRGIRVRFDRLQPAAVPERPHFPNRPLFLLAGLGLGLALGLAAALTAELRDPTVRDAEDLRALLPQALLSEIPLVRPRRFHRG